MRRNKTVPRHHSKWAKLQGMVIESDGAVSQKDREVREAQISELMLETERREIACIRRAEERRRDY